MKTVQEFVKMKKENKKMSIVTCYDYWSARIIDESNVDAVLVGDSASMVMHGFPTTVNANVEMMYYHLASVRRGTDKFIIADLPFLAHKKGEKEFFNTIDMMMKAGANAIKIEGADGNIELIKNIISSGVPVMGHLGLTPQSVNKLGGFKLQGIDKKSSTKILSDAKKLERAGCFSIVLEMIPSQLTKRVTEKLIIPTIGIGAGKYSSGQVLVLQDLLGLSKNFSPKFLRKYLNGYDIIKEALNNYNKDVKHRTFPGKHESY